MNRINILFIILFLSLAACSTEKEQPPPLKENSEQSLTPSSEATSEIKKNIPKKSKIPDIMTPLVGTDPCFEAVELIREPNDVKMYRDLGDSILLTDDEPARDDHRTYMGIIGAMLKKDRNVADIRQAILDTCRMLKKTTPKQD